MKKVLMIALAAGMLFGACSKDYLEKQPTEFISKTDIDGVSENSPHLAVATLNGLYALNVKAKAARTTKHDDFGQKGIDVYTDMLSGDMNLNKATYGWYSGIADLTDVRDFTSPETLVPWRFYYTMVRGANNVISSYAVKEETGSLTNEDKKVLAEAKSLRAYFYYNLVMLYTQGYAANEKVLPVYKEASLSNMPAKPTQEVFELMEEDLASALKLYEESGSTAKGVNVTYPVAQSIYAYVLAAKGTPDALVKAAELSKNVIDNSGANLASKEVLLGGFNKIASNPNWLWAAPLTTENSLDLISWWGQIDVFTYSYASVGDTKGMNKELYESIPANDVRKNQFEVNKITDASGELAEFGERAILPVNKFYASLGKYFQGMRIIESDYVFMRIEEMYLLNAEVNARSGNEGEAKTILKKFLEIRLDDVTYIDALSGQALKDEILKQTRIEFWGEGKVYAAIKRNNAKFNYGSNHLYHANQSFDSNNPDLTFKVPQLELLNNPVYNN
ncbi:RagB/SusD family nutrient uptake outer membrane protein [Myroides pelagicus]|uniref:RagB/SusD family nutrient uptake outer membrane protein n=1 Tax=Myroides pelagicus TaxID=270914 RepID=A0A7K1GJB1_9FLAO|nr:RagB/SusD family nutrient uptake outer membrane protein [Myroides pelagicus]MEC4113722.1 RagB/SusD family nutrient uptake outer membrane protein [Myroides pelagicus]MTH28820.1 RagB/SusD family nutrient uptake outer membrane protein [Myroides pelagicus]